MLLKGKIFPFNRKFLQHQKLSGKSKSAQVNFLLRRGNTSIGLCTPYEALTFLYRCPAGTIPGTSGRGPDHSRSARRASIPSKIQRVGAEGRLRRAPIQESQRSVRRTVLNQHISPSQTNFVLCTFRISRKFLVSKKFPIKRENFPF